MGCRQRQSQFLQLLLWLPHRLQLPALQQRELLLPAVSGLLLLLHLLLPQLPAPLLLAAHCMQLGLQQVLQPVWLLLAARLPSALLPVPLSPPAQSPASLLLHSTSL
jgi:hypothetical protein